jgi:tetratricopeptide (TPR) repeat protein
VQTAGRHGEDPTLTSELDTLEAKGLIQVAAYRPELEYLFRHWLVQDAAYGSLLKQERRQLHRLVGETLEVLYPERRAEMAGILAMHFEQAGDDARAVEYLIAAGRYALDRAALNEAFEAFDRADHLLPELATGPAEEREARARQRVEVAVLRAQAGMTFRPTEAQVADLETIVGVAEGLGDRELLAQILLHIALARISGGQAASDPAVRRSLDRLTEIGEDLDDPSLAALPLAMVAMGKIFTGPIGEGVEALERAIPLMERRRDFIGAAFSRGWLAMGYAWMGEFEKAAEASRQAYEEAAGGDLIAKLDAQLADSIVRSSRGDLEAAEPLARMCVEQAEETGAVACAVASSWVLGDVQQRQRRFSDARSALELGLELAPGTDIAMWGTTLRAWLYANPDRLAESEAGQEDWEELLRLARARKSGLGEASILWKRAQAAASRGRWEEADADFAASAELLERNDARPNLARVLRGWGEALRAAGRESEAEEKLRSALGRLEAMGLARESGEVRAELEGQDPRVGSQPSANGSASSSA